MLIVVDRIYSLIKRFPILRSMARWVYYNSSLLRRLLVSKDEKYYRRIKSDRIQKQVLVDVSHMISTDLNTGIQRVVRSMLKELPLVYGEEAEISPISLSSKGGIWHFRYVNLEERELTEEIVVPNKGDRFVGVDLNAMVVNAIDSGLFEDWKRRGTTISFTVHDILPITNPSWWPKGVAKGHENWLRSILSVSNIIVSVSESTCKEVKSWCRTNEINTNSVQFKSIHLGSELPRLSESKPDSRLDIDLALAEFDKKPTFLIVSTLEPRKGHAEALIAFNELIYERNVDVNLVIVGKKGWMVDDLINDIKSHKELNSRLFWFEGVTDYYLNRIYESSSCLLATSFGEGFGLPVIEAIRHGKPVIARDIAVFREVAKNYAVFFDSAGDKCLANIMESWIEEGARAINDDTNSHCLSWNESTLMLKSILETENS